MTQQRNLERFVQALLRAAKPVKPNGDGSIAISIMAGHILRRLSFSHTTASQALALGLAARKRGFLTLTREGRAWHTRASMPDMPFLAQHKPLRRESVPDSKSATDSPVDLVINDAESPLSWLRRRRGPDGRALIGDDAFAAGERLRADFTRANLMPRVTANWEATATSVRLAGGRDIAYSDVVIAARQKVRAAMTAVGPELSGVLLDICCFLKGLEDVEGERGWPVRSGKVVLTLALQRLAAHYGISAEARGPDRGRMRHWGKPGYRPSLADRKKNVASV